VTGKVDIANLALSWLGQAPIALLTEDTEGAILVNANYGFARDAVLEDGEWSFAVRYDKLAQDAAAPVAGYAYKYAIPGDVIRILSAREDTSQDRTTNPMLWEKQGGYVVTDSSTCYTYSIWRNDDPNQYTPGFIQAMAARLAADIAIPLTTSRTMQQQLWKLASVKLRDALNTDGMVGRSKKLRSSWLTEGR